MSRRIETDDQAFERWRDENPDEWDRMLGRTPGCPCAPCNGRIATTNDPTHIPDRI